MCLCFHSEIEIYCLQLTKETPFTHLHKLPPDFTHSKSKFLRLSLLLTGQMLLEMPEAKEFAVGFTFDFYLRWCLGLLGTVSFHHLFCFEGRVPVCPMLLTVLPHFPPLHPGPVSISEMFHWLFLLMLECLCTGRTLNWYLNLPSFRGFLNTSHCLLLKVRKPKIIALGCWIFLMKNHCGCACHIRQLWPFRAVHVSECLI